MKLASILVLVQKVISLACGKSIYLQFALIEVQSKVPQENKQLSSIYEFFTTINFLFMKVLFTPEEHPPHHFSFFSFRNRRRF